MWVWTRHLKHSYGYFLKVSHEILMCVKVAKYLSKFFFFFYFKFLSDLHVSGQNLNFFLPSLEAGNWTVLMISPKQLGREENVTYVKAQRYPQKLFLKSKLFLLRVTHGYYLGYCVCQDLFSPFRVNFLRKNAIGQSALSIILS